jgi:hypothetical protein
MLWRVARRLYLDHTFMIWEGTCHCRLCGEPWPCLGRRLGERGLLALLGPDPLRRSEGGPWWVRPSRQL